VGVIKETMNKTTHRVFRFIARLVLNLIAEVEIIGFENVPALGGFVIASNHIGRLDAALAYYILDRSDIIVFLAEKYEKYAFYRWLVKLTNGMFVDRYNADFRTVRETLRRLQSGQVLTITPEGTRSRSGALMEARQGGLYLAMKAGVPLLPVGLTGTDDRLVVESLKRFKRLKIKAVAGKAFRLPSVSGADREAALKQYTDDVMCRIAVLLPEERRGVYALHPRLQELLNN
jgi:1-acyl-sn-glycerol-3-phosphate acyltransferase